MKRIEGWEDSTLEAIKLALYIKKRYLKYSKNINGRDISPIKLQKSLYFLFAYWGQFIRKNKENKNSVEVDYSNYNEYLFEDKIEAWTYGPVVPRVFIAEKTGEMDIYKSEYKDNEFFKDELVKKEFIDNLLEQLFEIDDFGLVSISHQDECWKNNYVETDIQHNREIPKEDIINEYSRK